MLFKKYGYLHQQIWLYKNYFNGKNKLKVHPYKIVNIYKDLETK
jgi:hypothetical protein